MPKKKPNAPKSLPKQVPVELNLRGERTVLFVNPELVTQLTEVFAVCDRVVAAAERKAASGQPKRAISTERFAQGLLLLQWIDHFGKGTLTKELVSEIKNGCKDWPCVRDYKNHRSREKLRNALRNLADDTRRALRERRLPTDWVVP
jgi:hypothetical protein